MARTQLSPHPNPLPWGEGEESASEIAAPIRTLLEVVGAGEQVPVLGGKTRRYVNLDGAASTPAFACVRDTVNEFLNWYSNVHRGVGYKSRLSSWAFDEARKRVARFVGADPTDAVVLFCRNTTEAINRLAHRYPFRPGDVVLTSLMEHHSNELPWRRVAEVIHVGVTSDGRVDEEDLARKLVAYSGRVRLLAVTGASNVTGYLNPVHDWARMAHAAGAEIVVDAAQLAAHRPIAMRPKADPDRLDYVAFSAHKMYAPFGVGVLVGSRGAFETGDPDIVGGGAVDIVSLENAYWADLPDREEAGTPDIVGVVALARAIRAFEELGWERILRHEAKLTAAALARLSSIPGLIVYGDAHPGNAASRLGVVPFNVRGVPHALVAAVLSCEWGIGTRNGCFCAHPYVKALLHVSEIEGRAVEKSILARDRSTIPGAVRASFGLFNRISDIDALGEALEAICRHDFDPGYVLDPERGEYTHPEFSPDFASRFTF
ncbi:MAG TPA: aminotransferase class V-fold PLP-dependent enzyme [Thermoanaerobaculia bacterium]|nr:aminotransferase class V-fold PLP-dependent enzyme [Thermoanaerobaculia bacterium]